jgi:hypothetical protein
MNTDGAFWLGVLIGCTLGINLAAWFVSRRKP